MSSGASAFAVARSPITLGCRLFAYLLCRPRESRPGCPDQSRWPFGAFTAFAVAAKLRRSPRVVDAMATAPISKSILNDAGHNYPGHTELLAELSRTARVSDDGDWNQTPRLGAGYRSVVRSPKSCGSHAVKDIDTTLDADASKPERDFFGIASAPDRGCRVESRMVAKMVSFGDEEIKLLSPAVKAARKEGIPALADPFPADSLFYHAARGDYDAVVCMYHDQGLIPLEAASFLRRSRPDVGRLLFVRSVDHGTAYDIAGDRQGRRQRA